MDVLFFFFLWFHGCLFFFFWYSPSSSSSLWNSLDLKEFFLIHFLLNVTISGLVDILKMLLSELKLSKLKEFKILLQLYGLQFHDKCVCKIQPHWYPHFAKLLRTQFILSFKRECQDSFTNIYWTSTICKRFLQVL